MGVQYFTCALVARQVAIAETGATSAHTSTTHCHLNCFEAPGLSCIPWDGEWADESGLSPTRGRNE